MIISEVEVSESRQQVGRAPHHGTTAIIDTARRQRMSGWLLLAGVAGLLTGVVASFLLTNGDDSTPQSTASGLGIVENSGIAYLGQGNGYLSYKFSLPSGSLQPEWCFGTTMDAGKVPNNMSCTPNRMGWVAYPLGTGKSALITSPAVVEVAADGEAVAVLYVPGPLAREPDRPDTFEVRVVDDLPVAP